MSVSHGLKKNKPVLTPEEQAIGELLLQCQQAHLFASWPAPGSKDKLKKKFLGMVKQLNDQYPGGLLTYVNRAERLFEASASGTNPYGSWAISVPEGVRFETDTKEGRDRFDAFEAKGIEQLPYTAYVLVAGGVGSLAYSGVKVGLPTELTTGALFIQSYINHILALQAKARRISMDDNLILPLVIMTSEDTDHGTRSLLTEHKYFGMVPEQIVVLMQEKVPALKNSKAHFELTGKDSYELATRPHGHGDIHNLLFRTQIAQRWAEQNKRWIVFFQDTNPLAFRGVPAALGVSSEGKLAFNSVAVPRKSGEAMGILARVTGKGRDKTNQIINVEQPLMDLFFKGEKEPADDKNWSKFPGNTNVLVLDAQVYNTELTKAGGVTPEFANPKYKDKTRSQFAASARLECVMQDFVRLLGPEAPVSYTMLDRWSCYTAVKNRLRDGAKRQTSTGFSETAAQAEADVYYYYRKILREAGVNVDVEGVEEQYGGVRVRNGAKIVLAPSFGSTQAEIRSKFEVVLPAAAVAPAAPSGSSSSSSLPQAAPLTGIKISARSTLILDGEDIRISSLDLDGTLIIKACKGARVNVHDVVINNGGWTLSHLVGEEEKKAGEELQLRGYNIVKSEHVEVRYTKPGVYSLFKECQQGRPVKRKKKTT